MARLMTTMNKLELQPLPEGFRWVLEVHVGYKWVRTWLEQGHSNWRGKMTWSRLHEYSEVTRLKNELTMNIFDMPLDEVLSATVEASERSWVKYQSRGDCMAEGEELAAKLTQAFAVPVIVKGPSEI